MTDAEFAIKIFNWFTKNKDPEAEGEVYINGILERFQELPDQNQQILIYRLRDRMTYKEIGEIYGTTATAVRNNTLESHRLFLSAKCHTPIHVGRIIEQNHELLQDLMKMYKVTYKKSVYIDTLNRGIKSLAENLKDYGYPENLKKIRCEDLPAAVYQALIKNDIRYYEDLCNFWSFESMRSNIRNLGPSRMFKLLKTMWNKGYSEWILDTYESSSGLKKEIGEKFAECGIYLDCPELYINQKADS